MESILVYCQQKACLMLGHAWSSPGGFHVHLQADNPCLPASTLHLLPTPCQVHEAWHLSAAHCLSANPLMHAATPSLTCTLAPGPGAHRRCGPGC
jgi:hypothetical protein